MTTTVTAARMSGPKRMLRVVDALAEVFADLAAGATRSPSRTVVEHGDSQLLAGTAVWERRGVGSVKITTLTPDNPARGLPLIHGVVVLTDLVTGRITALLDGAELTAVRTGAVAALATRVCADPGADELSLVGAGVQARALVNAVSAVRPIRTVRVFSRTPARTGEFASWVRESHGLPVSVCASVRDAVVDSPIICTATSTSGSEPLVAADWVARGAHVNVIGGTHEDAVEVDPALLAAAFVVVEERAAAVEDAGEVRAALARGLITEADLHDLGTVTDRPVGTTVFRGVGMAIEDTAAAAALYEASG
ncbi:ornithine cyclodeaminase family protein [Actinokineospora auranticolor]|uniref:Ornithine cyclodeaminase n=1 Tax=Actinokineospora auranticolor TaxID=155976 RepID=A0A2S6H0Z0_9PSEU|nr:ornithine cyclodeaminase family protein [Actinokineospora auranticolor]PPK71077.1 ornithine cyclodeaminase [Actinokineospora auranticolor]